MTKKPEFLDWTKDGYPLVRLKSGKTAVVTRLLGPGDGNTKTAKNKVWGRTVGLSLAQHKSAGLGNLCPHAVECVKPCLGDQGRAYSLANIPKQRQAKTIVFHTQRAWFLDKLAAELDEHSQRARRLGIRLCARLNMFSDIPWEKIAPDLFMRDVTFYDYSKNPSRCGWILPNYHVTFSRDSTNEDHCLRHLAAGHNVAMVYWRRRPSTWRGFRVINGDDSDLRFLESSRDGACGRVVGLKLKTATLRQRKVAINSGFVVLTK